MRQEGDHALGTKVEVKNMNSFSAMQRAIDYEISRQVRSSCALTQECHPPSVARCTTHWWNGLQVSLHREGQGHRIVQETRLYDESKSETFSMRSKEGG